MAAVGLLMQHDREFPEDGDFRKQALKQVAYEQIFSTTRFQEAIGKGLAVGSWLQVQS